jgi:uncharacterized protein YbjT (DUF2867 family)
MEQVHIGGSGKLLITHGVVGRCATFLHHNAGTAVVLGRIAKKKTTALQARCKVFRPTPGHPPVTSFASTTRREDMKIVVIGGTGLIGTKVVKRLRNKGHEVVAASPNSGVNTITGEGLAGALAGAQVVVDLANSPSFEDSAVLKFFETAGHNLLAAEAAAGVKHHVALSVVGSDRLPESGYLRAKMAQERLIKASGIPYSIVRSTQFFEFMGGIAQSASVGQTVRVSPALVQPIMSDDVADAVANAALGTPVNGTIEIAGPERAPLDEMVRRYLGARRDPRKVIADTHARYFGTELDDRSLTPGDGARIGSIRFEDWLRDSTAQR